MDLNIIRSIIFLIAGLIVIIFPKKVIKLPSYFLKKFHIKYNVRKELKYYPYLGIIFILISITLFIVSIVY